jgi:hypothetical protein
MQQIPNHHLEVASESMERNLWSEGQRSSLTQSHWLLPHLNHMVYSNVIARKTVVVSRKRHPTTTAMVRHSLNINLHAIDKSHLHDISAAERNMSQGNSDPDHKSTDERKEEHEIKHFSLNKRGDYLDNFMTHNVPGFKNRPSYEEILEQQKTLMNNSKLPQ